MKKVINKRRILYIGNFLLPDGDAASHRVIGNAKALRNIGYDVFFLGCKIDENRALLDAINLYYDFKCWFFKSPNSIVSWVKYLTSITWYISLISFLKPTHIIVYNYPSIALKLLMKYCNKHSIYLYSDCTEWFQPQGNIIYKSIKQFDTNYRMKILHNKLSGIIAISSYLQNYYSNKGQKTICVPPLIDKDDIKWFNNGNFNNEAEVNLSYVGNPGAGKKDKLDVIISSLREIKSKYNLNCKLTIVGITKSEYEINFSDIINEDFIVFKGKMKNSAALEIIKKSHYSIFLRDKNLITTAGFPTKFSESIACGTPVLTNDSSDILKYINEGYNGFILDTSSSISLSESFYRALSINNEKISKMKEYCFRDYTFDFHSFESEFKKMFI